MKRVLVGGGSGFIGNHITKQLLSNGNQVTILSRTPEKAQKEYFKSNPSTNQISFKRWTDLPNISPDDVDVTINLTGRPIVEKRWNEEFKHSCIVSRTEPSKRLIDFLKQSKNPKTFVGTSAVGFYPSDQFDKVFTERNQTTPANNGLGDVCHAVEKEIYAHTKDSNVKSVIIRPGAVLGADGGMLHAMLLPIMMFVLTKFSKGNQPFPWIHVDDLARMYVFAAENSDKLQGPVNGTAPQQMTNEEFTKELCKALGRPTGPLFPVPGPLLKVAMGVDRSILILEGQHVKPEKALEAGFKFDYPDVPSALKEICTGKTLTGELKTLLGFH
jgi:hypothetical protein